VYDDGERLGIWVNAADDPDRCAFILPAIVRRGPVIVAVSTQGRSPVLASRLRDKLAAALPADLEERVERLSAERDRIHAEGGSTEVVDWSAFVDDL
jgi:siroheme synthase-like protein